MPNDKQEIEKLRKFLIRKFAITLFLVGIAEYLIMSILGRYFFPMLQWYILQNRDQLDNMNGSQVLGVALIIFAELLLRAVSSMLPAVAQTLTSRWIQSLENRIIARVPFMQQGLSVNQLNRGQSLLLFLAMVVMLVLMMLPLVIGAGVYAAVTTREVRRLEVRRDQWKQEYDRRRNLMLSDIAHDLRTPITTIAGYAKALADGMVEGEEKMQEYYSAMQLKSARLEELIQLLFEYVKLDSDGFSLNRTKVDLAELLRQNAAFIYPDAEAAGMELEADIPESPLWVELDEIQFGRVITNLLTNAVRHNEPGNRILLSLEKKDGQPLITVADNGNAIPPELAEHLFEPFARGDTSRSSRGGSGLGLSIAHKVVEMHGWKLEYTDSCPGYVKAFQIKM